MSTTVLRAATLALVYSTAQYCAPAWCRCAHTRLIDKLINDAWCIVTRCLRPTPTDNLVLLGGSKQLSFAVKMPYCLKLAAPGSQNICSTKGLCPPSCGDLRQLKSRHPLVPAALELNDLAQSGTSVLQWADYNGNMGWQEKVPGYIANVNTLPSKMFFPKAAWVKHNLLRTGIGLFRPTIHNWGMAPTAACKCGAKDQTAEHVITFFPIYHYLKGAHAFSAVGKSLVPWMTGTSLAM